MCITCLLLGWLCCGVTRAQTSNQPPILNDVGIDQKLDAQVPTDLVFKDESGNTVRLGDYFSGQRPIILTLVYYKCPMLCTMVLNDVTHSITAIPSLSVGKDFDILTVSFDPRETPALAAAKKRQYLKAYQRESAERGWHFLTGDETSIRKLADAVGFRYVFDPKSDQYAHASGLMILTPSGRVSRYFYGIDYSSKDLRLALTEASSGTISSPVERVLLYCFHYDPTTGKYSLAITRLLRGAAILTLASLGTFWIVMHRRERRTAVGAQQDSPPSREEASP